MKPPAILKHAFLGLALICWIGAATNNSPAPAAVEQTKPCFQCGGTGKTTCPDPKCKKGQTICPGKCMKLSVGVWEHMNVPGHPPTELWQKFRYGPNGASSVAWTQGHVGDVIEMRNGMPVNIGKCAVCGGKTQIKCPICKGAATVSCNICEGLNVVPESWTVFDNPKMKNRPARFHLKDGRVIVGRKTMALGDSVTINTEKGIIEVDIKNILSEEKQPIQK